MKKKFVSKEKGFTLIEIIIVVAILLILAAAAVPLYGNLQVSAQLNENNRQIVQTIRIARERAASGFNNSNHGVEFQSDRYILYQGNDFASRDTVYDRETVLDAALTITTTLTGDEVNFSRGSGDPNNTGTITLTHSVTGSKESIINQYGAVEGN